MFFLKKYRDSSLVKNSFILILGTSIAQFLPLIIYPILARLYSPDDFGFLATLTAITSILCVISTGKYESAILIADNETKSINLIALVFAVSLIVLLLISIFVCLFIGSIKDFLGIEKSGFYLLICPLSALFINVFNVYNEWCVRNKLYKRLSYNKIVSSTMVSGGKLVFGVFRFFNSGLIVGDLSGRALTAFVCLHRMYVHELHLLKSISLKQIVTQARRFKDFPKFTMPAQLLNTVGGAVPVLLLGKYYSGSDLGHFSMTMSALMIPVNVISISIRDVFRQKANEIYKGGNSFRGLFKKMFIVLFIVTFVCSIGVSPVLPHFFTLVLGEKWLETGEIAQILLPMIALDFVAMSLSGVLTITEKLKYNLYWQIYFVSISVISILLGSLYFTSFYDTIFIFSLGRSTAYLFLLFLSYKFSNEVLTNR